MIVTCRQMREIEEAAFARGMGADELMEQAGCGIASVVRQFFPTPGSLMLFLGKGNNAGDALVAARELQKIGWRIGARLAFSVEDFKPLPAKHWRGLEHGTVAGATGAPPTVVFDGLLGIGAAGPLSGALGDLSRQINALRKNCHATVVAMDIPSGLDGDSGVPFDDCVEADITVTIGHVKAGLVADGATAHVGRLAQVPLDGLEPRAGDASASTSRAEALRSHLPRRSFEFHKGQAGRVGIVAGSRGFVGAAVLASTGALRGGAGLVSLIVREDIYPIAAAMAPPEVMVRVVRDYRELLADSFDALAIGPGVGLQLQDEILEVIRRARCPAVVDADALTIIARAGLEVLDQCAAPRLLTPHPGEMARLIVTRPEWQSLDRRRLAESFAAAHPSCALLLKGARTVVAQYGEVTSFNTTGTPGMATGGMGDVLTGLCSALMAQGVSCRDAARLGAWLSGRAAEIAIASGGQSVESLAAGDVARNLGRAFDDMKAGAY